MLLVLKNVPFLAKLLTVFQKYFIVGVWNGSEYVAPSIFKIM